MLTEPITGAALEASPEREGEASLLSEHSADVRRFHAAVAQNQRLLAERTAPAAPRVTEPVAARPESMLPTEPMTRPGSPPKEWRSRSAEGRGTGSGWCQEFPFGASDTRALSKKCWRGWQKMQMRSNTTLEL